MNHLAPQDVTPQLLGHSSLSLSHSLFTSGNNSCPHGRAFLYSAVFILRSVETSHTYSRHVRGSQSSMPSSFMNCHADAAANAVLCIPTTGRRNATGYFAQSKKVLLSMQERFKRKVTLSFAKFLSRSFHGVVKVGRGSFRFPHTRRPHPLLTNL